MRHPEDPEPVRDSKATATFWLGVLATVTGAALGGIVPATVALILAGQARRELAEGQGWRTGTRRVAVGERLAWTGLALALLSLTAAIVIGLLRSRSGGSHDFPPSVN